MLLDRFCGGGHPRQPFVFVYDLGPGHLGRGPERGDHDHGRHPVLGLHVFDSTGAFGERALPSNDSSRPHRAPALQ
jgi:hypothetical protein